MFSVQQEPLHWDLHYYQGGAKEKVVSVKLKSLEIAFLAQLLQSQVRCLSGSFSC